jgi:hypothetical protein
MRAQCLSAADRGVEWLYRGRRARLLLGLPEQATGWPVDGLGGHAAIDYTRHSMYQSHEIEGTYLAISDALCCTSEECMDGDSKGYDVVMRRRNISS